MARPKANVVIEEDKVSLTLIRMWTPKLLVALAKKIIEEIQGVHSVHYNMERGLFVVWLNPCYDKAEIMAEIKEGIDAAAD